MIQKYSLAFIPNNETITLVKEMKLKLADTIGWYASKNAVAHITVCEFEIEETRILAIEKKITQIATTITPINVTLNTFGSYPNGAFFIAPDAASKTELKNSMKQFNSRLKIPNQYKSNDPHLSIARKLDAEKLAIASTLFTTIQTTFYCENISLRKLNPGQKQFEIVNSFPFKSETSTEGIQTSLF